MLITEAYAQAPGGGGPGDLLGSPIIMMVLIFVVFYFLLIRPQQKKMKAHREMIAAVRRGDRVVTGGGLIGQIIKVVNDAEVMMEIAEGVRVRVLKSSITDVLAKGEPIRGAKKEEEEGDEAPPPPPPAPPPSQGANILAGLSGLLGLGKKKP